MRLKTAFYVGAYCWLTVVAARAGAQMVQPVIMEYTAKASGKLLLTNNTMEPLAVTLEPRSFSIEENGHGLFRKLDSSIHVELSAMSVKLQPKETYYIFYKASAEVLPAWFTIYATFSPLHHGPDVSVRVQLPHTVYLYQKTPLQKADVQVKRTYYSASSHKVICELTNTGASLGRAKGAQASGPHGGSAQQAGFPMLPGMTRKVELDWTAKDPPTEVQLDFDHFSIKVPIDSQESAPVAAASSVAGTVR